MIFISGNFFLTKLTESSLDRLSTMIIGTSIISEKGQVTIPKEIRDKLGIVQGDRLVFDLKGNEIIIKKTGTNKVSKILKEQKPWKISSVEFQRKLRDEWE